MIKYIKGIIKKSLRIIPDKLYLKFYYRIKMGTKLNLKNPKSFNEKLQWLKLYDRNPLYTKLADKYEVREYIKNTIGEEYLIPLLGVYDAFDEIDLKKLPNKFVMKCNHDSASVIICKNKLNFNYTDAKKQITRSLKSNYFWGGREWVYKNIKPRIVIEKYMKNKDDSDLSDYKFFCFNGKVKFFKIDFDRFNNHGANYYDLNKKIMRFGEKVCPPNYNKKIEMPESLNKMIELAEKISKGMIFTRVDFYNINEKIYFGEITFYPAGGFGKFIPEEWDYKIGDMLKIPNEKR